MRTIAIVMDVTTQANCGADNNTHDWKRVGYRSSKNASSVCTVEFECSRCGKRKFVDTPTGNAMYTGNEKGIKDLTING